MLQIATGMYFGDRPVHQTRQRATFHTNASMHTRDPVDVPDGRLMFDTVLEDRP